ncbi:MAG: LacI family DNA-binding transcriptional regulator [Arachnia sp.]
MIPGQSRVTIEDVAFHAGVSRAAVSKVIRNAYGVSDAMRSKVQDAIDTLGYRPRAAARTMRGSSYTIGIELPNTTNSFFHSVIGGMTDALADTPYQLIIAPARPGHIGGPDAIQQLADRQVDGIIAFAPQVSVEWLEQFALQTPTVLIGRHDDSVNYDTVVDDDELGSRLVVDHLIGLGHRDIVHLTIPIEDLGGHAQLPHARREVGFVNAMTEAGLAGRIRIERTAQTEEAVCRRTHELLDEPHPPTALYAGHDDLALGALRAVAERGLTAADLSVVGYDDTTISAHPLISLTTVNQSASSYGERVSRLLLERMAGRTEAVHDVITPTLKGRGSTTAPNPR